VVVDHTKFGQISTSYVAPISMIDTVVTDSEAPADYLKRLTDMGINVVQA
jgi:DeoR/GlpR family transcriptional regulator of sugar metabolism